MVHIPVGIGPVRLLMDRSRAKGKLPATELGRMGSVPFKRLSRSSICLKEAKYRGEGIGPSNLLWARIRV
eukprot:Gb_34854 [translate_table: standard]